MKTMNGTMNGTAIKGEIKNRGSHYELQVWNFKTGQVCGLWFGTSDECLERAVKEWGLQ